MSCHPTSWKVKCMHVWKYVCMHARKYGSMICYSIIKYMNPRLDFAGDCIHYIPAPLGL